jgi:hypothetical protein
VSTTADRVDHEIARTTREIEATCLAAPLFKILAPPAIDAGIDTVCDHPGLYASGVVSIELLVRALRDRQGSTPLPRSR